MANFWLAFSTVNYQLSLAQDHQNADWTSGAQPIPPDTSNPRSFLTGIKQEHSDNKRRLTCCVYCKGSHCSIACTVVDDYQKCLAIVKKASLCFNCLGHHKVSQCGSKIHCKHCSRKHHSSLCSSHCDESYK